MLITTNTRGQPRIVPLAGATRDPVANAFGAILDVRVCSNVDQVAAKDVVVDATFELRREFQEWRGDCICCGTAHVSCVYLNGRYALTFSFAA